MGNLDDTVDVWEHTRVVDYITHNGFTRITLQFPDELLQHAHSVAADLQKMLLLAGSKAQVYVLADTSYNPLSIDEVAAAHVQADCVVHYGYASLHPVSRVPALCVLPKAWLDVQETSTWILQQMESLHDQVQQGITTSSQPQQQAMQRPVCVICCDQQYLHQLPQLQQEVQQAYTGVMRLVFAQSGPAELWPQGRVRSAASDTNRTQTAAAHAQPTASRQSTPLGAPVGGSSCVHTASCGTAATSSCDTSCSQSDSHASPIPVPIGGLVWHVTCSHSQGQATNSSSSSGSSGSGSSGSGSCNSDSSIQPVLFVWLGPCSSPALTHLQLSYAADTWLLLDPSSKTLSRGLSPGLDRLLKRRFYLVEKARSAVMVGLLVGTLGAAGYKTALEQLRRLATQAEKKTYTLLMGKPNPAKLANFPEIEVFVMLADPQGLILDCKEYLRPIVTPHEAFLAFTGRDLDPAHYRLDFEDLLQLGQHNAANSSGSDHQHGNAADIGGNISGCVDHGDDDAAGTHGSDGDGGQALQAGIGGLILADKGMGTALIGNAAGKQIQVRSAAQYLVQQRTYRGLETPATGAAVLPAAAAVQGRSGRAAGYQDEPKH